MHIVHSVRVSNMQVMLTTDHGYTSSDKCPKVLWARQVARAAMDEPKMCTYGRWGLHPVNGLDLDG